MNTIVIRRPKIDHLQELVQFFTLVINDTFNKEGIGHLLDDIEKEIEDKVKLLKSDFNSNGVDRYFLLAVESGQVVGTIEFGRASHLINECTNGELQEIVEVGTVFVHPDYQKRGIGNLLLNVMYITLQSKGIHQFCLDSGYKNAQKIWRKKFGEPQFLLKNYWGDSFDHMIWRKRVSDLSIMFKV